MLSDNEKKKEDVGMNNLGLDSETLDGVVDMYTTCIAVRTPKQDKLKNWAEREQFAVH